MSKMPVHAYFIFWLSIGSFSCPTHFPSQFLEMNKVNSFTYYNISAMFFSLISNPIIEPEAVANYCLYKNLESVCTNYQQQKKSLKM